MDELGGPQARGKRTFGVLIPPEEEEEEEVNKSLRVL